MTAAQRGSIMLISDIHAHFPVLDAQLEHAQVTLGHQVHQVLVLGDFGMFGPNLHDHFRRDGRRFGRPVAFIEGNHEDFRNFDKLVADYTDVVSYLPRGSVHRFGAWNWLCLGGARYMDAWSTPPGCEIREEDITPCLAMDPGSVDFVISHDCPTDIGVPNEGELGHLGPPGVEGFATIAAHFEPRLWVFGHHHRWYGCEINGTRYVGLPQSWQGYVLVDGEGALRRVENRIDLPTRPAWLKWIGLK